MYARIAAVAAFVFRNGRQVSEEGDILSTLRSDSNCARGAVLLEHSDHHTLREPFLGSR